MRRSCFFTLALGGLFLAPAAIAQDAAPDVAAAIVACRAEPDAERRLACYDAASRAFEAAQASGDIVVVDRAQAAESQRRGFGLTLGSINPFTRDSDAVPPIEAVDGRLASARQGGDGRWVFVLEDGAEWAQVESLSFYLRPRPGDAIRIRRAAFGSYLLTLPNFNQAIRVRRR